MILKGLKCVSNASVKYFRKINTLASASTIFSGIQPTGVPHLGNYFGVIRRWAALQKDHNCVFSIVDLHSITLPQDPKKLRHNIHLMTASLLACGIDPEKSILFLQSQVPQHAELSWIIGCLTTMARLTHLPQYKDKSGGSSSDIIPLGLFIYPVLQSADILLYKANSVPVGEDQVQHIQLCQHFVKVFNNRYGKIFPVPMPLIDQNSSRIKSLKQPEKKMSKSDLDFKNRIELTDSPDIVTKRIKEALTDFTSAVTYDPLNRPGVSNLILMHSLCTGKSFETICKESENINTGAYKLVVAKDMVEYLQPIQKRIQDLMSDPSYLASVLRKGSEKASEIASRTICEVKNAVGLSLDGKL